MKPMIPVHSAGQSAAMVPWQDDFLAFLIEDYEYKIKNEISGLGIRSLCYDEKEHTLIIANTSSRRVHLINVETGALRWYDHHETTVRHIVRFRNEIITSSWDGTVRAVNFNDLSQRLALTERFMGRSPFVTVSSDGNFIFSFSYDVEKNPLIRTNIVRKWSCQTGRLLHSYSNTGPHKSKTRSGVCLPIGERLYVISNSGFLNVFHLHSGRLLKENSIQGDFRTMCHAPAFNILIATDITGFVHLYHLGSDWIFATYQVHQDDITGIQVHPRKPEIVLTCSFDGVVKIWELPGFKSLSTIPVDKHELWSFAFIDELLVVGSTSGFIYIYDISNLREPRLKGKLFLSENAYSVFSNDSRLFYTNNISIFDLFRKKDGEPVAGKQSDYLLQLFNSKQVLDSLFGKEEKTAPLTKGNKPWMRQIPDKLPLSP